MADDREVVVVEYDAFQADRQRWFKVARDGAVLVVLDKLGRRRLTISAVKRRSGHEEMP